MSLQEFNDDMIDKFEELINYFPEPIIVSIAFSDGVITLANEKMTQRGYYDKQAVIGMAVTGLVDYLSCEDIPLDERGR